MGVLPILDLNVTLYRMICGIPKLLPHESTLSRNNKLNTQYMDSYLINLLISRFSAGVTKSPHNPQSFISIWHKKITLHILISVTMFCIFNQDVINVIMVLSLKGLYEL